MERKNIFLQPLYRDLKVAIKNMTYSEEYKLMREYVRNRALILEALPEGSSKANDGLNALRDQYAKLLLNHKIRSKTEPGRKLRVMKKRMEDMFTLLNLW